MYILFVFVVGLWCGYAFYAWTIAKAIERGRIFIKKNNKWYPYNPFREAK